MNNMNLVNIQKFNPKDKQVHIIIKKLCKEMESKYEKEYKERFIKMLNDNILNDVFIIFYNNLPIGLSLLRSASGNFFEQSEDILKITMFRIIPSHRNKGIGKLSFIKINKMIFDSYNINTLYAASTEYGALKLYSKLDNIQFFDNQYTNNIKFSLNILSYGLPNHFTFSNDIKFKIFSPNYLNNSLH